LLLLRIGVVLDKQVIYIIKFICSFKEDLNLRPLNIEFGCVPEFLDQLTG
jgi:hypothetical protein